MQTERFSGAGLSIMGERCNCREHIWKEGTERAHKLDAPPLA